MIVCGDALSELRKINDDSIDSMVTDPPAGIGFMSSGKKDHWDSDKGGREAWCSWMSEIMSECLRVLKPGAHAFVWAIPRTSHWTATAIEDAGFEIRDVVTHLFGSGFPKSLDVSKAIDKAAGAEREVVGTQKKSGDIKSGRMHAAKNEAGTFVELSITAPATEAAKQWQGWGTALKPASEHWILCRKPLSEKTVAKNVLLHGTGALNIDASRVGLDSKVNLSAKQKNFDAMGFGGNSETNEVSTYNSQGRWPANLCLSHNLSCVEVGTKQIKSDGAWPAYRSGIGYQGGKGTQSEDRKDFGDGTETVSAWECTEDCAVAMLDAQSGNLHGRQNKTEKKSTDNGMFGNGIIRKNKSSIESIDLDKGGGASRFFYVAKASKRERNAGCEGLGEKEKQGTRPNSKDMSGKFPDNDLRPAGGNNHPTVKPLKLMAYLIKMITPHGGLILDPFMGSGSTLVAAKQLGYEYIGIEKELEYFTIAEKRLGL